MANSSTILRKSIHHFLVNYHYFTSVSASLALPFSIAILLSQYLFLPSSDSPSSSLFWALFNRLHYLFEAAGFPSSSGFFRILNLKLSQTVTCFVFALPFTFTFLILAKSSVILAFNHFQNPVSKSSFPSFSSLLSIFNPLLLTFFCNAFLIVSANATAFTFLFLSFNFLDFLSFSSPTSTSTSILLLSTSGAVVYSVILANAIIVSNLALVLSGVEKSGGFLPFLKAGLMMKGRASTALSIALPVNLALAGVEALFQYRIVNQYHWGHKQTLSYLMVVEGVLIAYIYSNLIVVDTIVSCIFLKSCKEGSAISGDEEEEGKFSRIQLDKNEEHDRLKVCQQYV